MSLLVAFDDFATPGSLGAPWTIRTADKWTVGSRMVSPLNAPSVYRRAMFGPDIRTLASAGANPIRSYEIEATLRMPDTFSATEDLSMGIGILGSTNMANTAVHHEIRYRRTAAGADFLDFLRRDAAGTVTSTAQTYAFSGVLSAPMVGEVHVLSVTVDVLPVGNVQFTFRWDGTIRGTIIRTPAQMGISALTAPHYIGFGAVVPGPANPSPPPPSPLFPPAAPQPGAGDPTYPVFFGALRVRDLLATQPPLTSAPVSTPEPTLTTVTIGDEDTRTGQSLPIQPDQSESMEYVSVDHEHRYDGGYVATRRASSRRRHVWTWTWSHLTDAQRSTMETFVGVVGTHEAFDMYEPDTGYDTVGRFVFPPVFEEVGPGVHRMSAEVEEVLT